MTGDVDAMDPLQRCLPNKNGYQNIMALPVNAGSGVFFSHRILHWGSRGRKGYAIPRMALSIACSTEDFEPSYFANSTEQLPYPDLEVRLGLICGQCICYHERFSFNGKQMKLTTENLSPAHIEPVHRTGEERYLKEPGKTMLAAW